MHFNTILVNCFSNWKGVKELNKKILVAVLLAGIMLAVPLVSAVPWTYPKNNDKFEEFAVVGSFSFLDIIFGDHQYVPSYDEVNKLVISWEENMLSYEISVDGNTYTLGVDFTYTGIATLILYNPVFTEPTKLWTEDVSQSHTIVDYMYDFGDDDGGIDGTLTMRYVVNKGTGSINTLAGTGDLRNVQIKATAWNVFDPATYILTIYHEGRVSGWPE